MKQLFDLAKRYIFRTLCVLFVLTLGLTQKTLEVSVVGWIAGFCLLTVGSLHIRAYHGWINTPRRWLPIIGTIFVDTWVAIILSATLLPGVTTFVAVMILLAGILGALGALEKQHYRVKAVTQG